MNRPSRIAWVKRMSTDESGQVVRLRWGDLGLVGKAVLLLFVPLILFGVAGLVVVSYPDSMKWTAPVLCPDDLPNSEVVRYEGGTVRNPSTGAESEGVNFSLVCSNSRGEVEDVGMLKPIALLTVWIVAAVAAIGGVLFAVARLRRRGAVAANLGRR